MLDRELYFVNVTVDSNVTFENWRHYHDYLISAVIFSFVMFFTQYINLWNCGRSVFQDGGHNYWV